MAEGTRDDPIPITDRDETKLLQCSYPGCGLWLEVTKFESASRARCRDHKGKTAPSYRGEDVEAVTPDAPVNKSLGRLACPFHPDDPMELIRVHETMGFLTFKCRISSCSCAVEIMPEWGPMVIPHVPEDLRPLVDAFNEGKEAVSQPSE